MAKKSEKRVRPSSAKRHALTRELSGLVFACVLLATFLPISASHIAADLASRNGDLMSADSLTFSAFVAAICFAGALLAGTVFIYFWQKRTLAPLIDINNMLIEKGDLSSDQVVQLSRNDIRQTAAILKETFDEAASLKEEAARFQLVSDATDHAVVVTDADGYLIWVNPGFTEMTGYEPEEVVGRKPGHFLRAPEADPSTAAKINRGLRELTGFDAETLNMRKDGTRFWARIEVRPSFDDNGNLQHFIGVERDITEEKRTHAALESNRKELQQRIVDLQTAKSELEEERSKLAAFASELSMAKDAAENANRAKSEFLATISHELRTPMNGVLGMADLLINSPLNSEQQDHARAIRESGKSLLVLLNDILDLSRLEESGLELEYVEVRLSDVVTTVLDVMGANAREKDLELVTEIDPAIPEIVMGDPTRMRQILFNLTSNAIKFTDTGRITVRVAPDPESGADFISCSVTDTGIGIAEDAQKRLFERFSQADSSISRTHGGTGLGLAICRELAELMGGTIEVESELGKGSAFKVSLPLSVPDDRSHPAPAEAKDTGTINNAPASTDAAVPSDTPAGWRVLVAEDQPINAKLIKAIMDRLGHEIKVATNGVEVIKELREDTFDLVLMDIQMPEMDGVLATKVIRSSDADWKEIPIIALTAHAMAGTRETYLQAGMDGFVSKPISIDLLVDEMNRVMIEKGREPLPSASAALDEKAPAAKADAPDAQQEEAAEPDVEAFLTDLLDDIEESEEKEKKNSSVA